MISLHIKSLNEEGEGVMTGKGGEQHCIRRERGGQLRSGTLMTEIISIHVHVPVLGGGGTHITGETHTYMSLCEEVKDIGRGRRGQWGGGGYTDD